MTDVGQGSGLQSRTLEYRWPVVRTGEPVGIRTIQGYVTILERQTPDGAPLAYHLLFFDVNGQPIQQFEVEQFAMFADAAGTALKTLGILTERLEHETIGDII